MAVLDSSVGRGNVGSWFCRCWSIIFESYFWLGYGSSVDPVLFEKSGERLTLDTAAQLLGLGLHMHADPGWVAVRSGPLEIQAL